MYFNQTKPNKTKSLTLKNDIKKLSSPYSYLKFHSYSV